MSISAVNSISFKGNTQPAQTTQTVQQERKVGGVAPAVGSLIIPGLGHFMNGDNKAGFKFLGGQIGLGALTVLSLLAAGIAESKESRALAIVGAAGTLLSSIGGLALKIVDIVKAYRGEQPKENKQAESKVDTQA